MTRTLTPENTQTKISMMTGYELTNRWYEFKFENPSRVRHVHSDLFFYLVYLWNKLGKKREFGLPTDVTMEALGIGSYNTYKATLNDLIEFGAVELVKDSKNQHHSKVIALSFFDKAIDKAIDKATDKASTKAIDKATDTIIKEENKRIKELLTDGTAREKENFKNENSEKTHESKPEEIPKESPPIPAPPPYDWNTLPGVLKTDTPFREWAMRELKVDAEKMEDLILDYIVFQHGKGNPLNPDYRDLKSHIINHSRIRLEAHQTNGNANKPTHNPKRNLKPSGTEPPATGRRFGSWDD